MDEKPHILIVDDDSINLQVLTMALRGKYTISAVTNGHDAIRQVALHPPDLILLDVMMPDLNGFDVCRIIKSKDEFADIPILFLTAMDTAEGATMGLELGGVDYLTKPVNIGLLRLRVHNHIELKRRNDLVREQRDLLARQKDELESALSRIKRLEGIIPICMCCKSIRTEGETWQNLEIYMAEHTDALFSHGYCPRCYEKEIALLEL